jgi:hypothetical protein
MPVKPPEGPMTKKLLGDEMWDWNDFEESSK